jgi:hypothetical protein
MLESLMFKKLKAVYEKENLGKLYRIETWRITPGVPDCNFVSFKGFEGWIELKQTKTQKTGKIIIPYRPGQQGFLYTRELLGLKVYTLLSIDKMFYLINRDFIKKDFLNVKELSLYCSFVGKDLKQLALHISNGG